MSSRGGEGAAVELDGADRGAHRAGSMSDRSKPRSGLVAPGAVATSGLSPSKAASSQKSAGTRVATGAVVMGASVQDARRGVSSAAAVVSGALVVCAAERAAWCWCGAPIAAAGREPMETGPRLPSGQVIEPMRSTGVSTGSTVLMRRSTGSNTIHLLCNIFQEMIAQVLVQ
jgi:hypothetical protein